MWIAHRSLSLGSGHEDRNAQRKQRWSGFSRLFLLLNNDILFVSLPAAAKEAEAHVECSTAVPEAVCAPARKRKAAEMCGCAVSATADGTEEPPAKTAAVVRTVAEAVVDPQS